MNNGLNLKARFLPILSLVAVVFLFSSPAALAVSSPASSTPAVNPAATSSWGYVNTVRVPASPGSPDKGSGGDTFVSNVGTGAVDVLSSEGKLVTEIEDGGCSGYGVTYAPTTKMIYVFDYACGTVYVINPSTMKVVTSYGCAGCIFGAYAPTDKLIYVSLFGYGEVETLDPTTGALGTPITVCGTYPEFIAFSPPDQSVYVPSRLGCYSIISTPKNTVTNVTLGTYPNGVACASSGKEPLCWITDEDNGNVYEVSGSRLLATVTGCAGCNWGDGYSPASKTAYVSSTNDEVWPIKGDKLGTAISTSYGSDDNCYALAKEMVVPLSSSPGYASGISKSNKVVWTTQLGSDSEYSEACAAS